jgi:hypothetical protein
MNPGPNGYKSKWDSDDDQLSIEQGFKYVQDHDYQDIHLSKTKKK